MTDTTTSEVATYEGPTDTRLIADGSNPWIEIDGKSVDWVEWDKTHQHILINDPCGEGVKVIVPGVLHAMDTAQGVARCDACGTYDGDLSAAAALARFVGGVVKFEVESE